MSTPMLVPEDIRRVSGCRVVFDTETNGLHWWTNWMIGVGIYCPDADLEGYIYTPTPSLREEVRKEIQALTPDTVIINHNLKFDLHFLGVDPEPFTIMDTMVMVHLMDSRYRKALDKAEATFLGSNSKRQHVMEAPKRKKIWEWPLEVVAAYCVNDCRVTYQLAETLMPLLERDMLVDLFWKDMEYLKVILKIERKGILLDHEFIRKAQRALQEHVRDLEQELWDSVGYEFNWRSHQQLSKALYEDMGHPRPVNPFLSADGVDRTRFADRGRYNSTLTSTFILMEKADHPLGELVGSLRESHKLGQTLESWIQLSDANRVIHTNFKLTGTRTGRLSSAEPNIQNVPSQVRTRFTQGTYTGGVTRTEEYNLRSAFTARPGNVFVAVDYKQMEMRMFGILSGDPIMLKSLAAGRDIHADVATAVWGTSDPVHREWAKTIGFGLIYAMTAGALQMRLNMSASEAKNVTEQYWHTFPRIRPFLFEAKSSCEKFGFVRYWSGRLWREESDEHHYKAANALIQGGCADVLSIAALRVDEWFREVGYGHIVSLVHDEIISEVPEDKATETALNVKRLMAVPDLFNIPWFTDAKIGTTYGNLEKVSLEVPG